MDQNEIEQWLAGWFKDNGRQGDIALDTGADFIEQGWIDSFGILQLLAGVEEQFHVELNESHFAAEGFSTIAGLAGIVARQAAAQKQRTSRA